MAKSVKKASKPGAGKSHVPSSSSPPPPFKAPPIELKDSLLSTLDPSHIYLTHIDIHPTAFKRRVFTVPILMNTVIAFALIIRFYFAIPAYFSIFVSALGGQPDATVDVYHTTWTNLAFVIAKRAVMFMFDYAFFVLLVRWPWDFCFGSPGNPLQWRRSVGFRDQEIIVRKSRNWDQLLPEKWMTEDEATVKQKIMPAIDKTLLHKTGYLLLDQDWDLDYAAMVTAHTLVDAGTLPAITFVKLVLVHYPPAGGWIYWDVYAEDSPGREPGREKIMQFQQKLTAMGKEDLFFRWVEIVQYESTQPGGFTPERQGSAMAQAKKLFQEQGVDFEAFWKDVGGMEGIDEAA